MPTCTPARTDKAQLLWLKPLQVVPRATFRASKSEFRYVCFTGVLVRESPNARERVAQAGALSNVFSED